MSLIIDQKKYQPDENQDWHAADIIAALKKTGWSLRGLSIHHGYSGWTLKNAIGRPYPKAEKFIGQAIGIDPWEIWPSRYDVITSPEGQRIGIPNRTPGRKKVA